MIRRLQALRVGQPIREIGPDHQQKAGTPTMGGLLILLVLSVSVLLWADLSSRATWVVLGLTLGYGALGFVDDYRKVTRRNSEGISARAKLFWQGLLALGVAVLIYTDPLFDGMLQVPFFKAFTPHIGFLYIPLAALFIAFMSNAVNLTDGLDGLAIGPVMISAATFMVLAYAAGHATFADYLRDHAHPERGRARHLLRRAGRRRARLPVVQRVACAGVHGRRRRARAGRRARGRGRDDSPGDPARGGRRDLRGRSALGDDPGRLFPAGAAGSGSS